MSSDSAPRVGIVGYGEIGSAVAALFRRRGLPEPIVHDPALGMKSAAADADVVHVCVPGPAVEAVVTGRETRLWIVHSTVRVGTCRAIASRVRGRVVHAPVRGVHPNLVAGLEAFTMPVGGPRDGVETAVEHLTQLGVRAVPFGPWENTELGKLLCTLRYGMDILFMRHAAELCAQYGADFERVYTEWTKQYSDGFEMLGQWWFRRAVLKPMPGAIGGHCVVPNARLLAADSELAQFVADAGAEPWTPPAGLKVAP